MWKRHKYTFVPDGDYGNIEGDAKDTGPTKKVKPQNKKTK
jgi:hypothetical protein